MHVAQGRTTNPVILVAGVSSPVVQFGSLPRNLSWGDPIPDFCMSHPVQGPVQSVTCIRLHTHWCYMYFKQNVYSIFIIKKVEEKDKNSTIKYCTYFHHEIDFFFSINITFLFYLGFQEIQRKLGNINLALTLACRSRIFTFSFSSCPNFLFLDNYSFQGIMGFLFKIG